MISLVEGKDCRRCGGTAKCVVVLVDDTPFSSKLASALCRDCFQLVNKLLLCENEDGPDYAIHNEIVGKSIVCELGSIEWVD